MLIGTTLHAFAQYAMMSWSALFYMRVHQMPLADVASWLALMNGLGGGIGIYLGGRLSDAAGSRNPAGRVWVSAAAMLLMVPAALVQFLIPSLTASLAFGFLARSEEHTSELQSLMRISYAVFCLKKKKQ